jgi:hypothetical protein
VTHAVTSVVSFFKLPPTQSESQHGLPDANPLRSPPFPLELQAATAFARLPSGASLLNEGVLTMEAWRAPDARLELG